jgi:hypothetical protein
LEIDFPDDDIALSVFFQAKNHPPKPIRRVQLKCNLDSDDRTVSAIASWLISSSSHLAPHSSWKLDHVEYIAICWFGNCHWLSPVK